MRSYKLTNNLGIALQCAAFAVLILYGALGTPYQNPLAATGRSAAAGFCIPRKIAGFAGLSSGGDQDIPRRNSAGHQTIALYMNGTLSPGAPCLRIFPPSRNIKGLADLDQDGSRDIFRMNSATGNIVVLHAPGLVHRGRDPNAVRAPPQVAVKCGHRFGYASPRIDGGDLSTPSLTCTLFPRGARPRLIFSTLYIRAPPIAMLHS